MLISKKWLSQYMDLSDITMEEIADKITNAGLEVEGIEYGASATNLVIGEVLESTPIPDTHLNLTKVNDGTGVRQIVCGAPNCRAGLKVIVALPGAKLPGGEIKSGEIRGNLSDGMLCSLLELGVDAKSLTDYQKSGIEELPLDAPVGETNVLGYLGLDDIVLDVGLTPNRSDCLAAFAMAKETGAVLKKEVTLPKYEGCADIGAPTSLKVSSATDKCPLYLGKIIREVTIKESPKWMKELLMSANVKSINNVVDISNLVMLETGQPLHFFDLAKLEKEEVVVRDDLDCEYTALDEVTYKIEPGDLMITMNGKPSCIAGIMGGDDSKIDNDTKGILIESATFNSVSIRNTARKFNLSTDASVRNSKNIEPNAPYAAMDRAVQLLIEYADAKGIEETATSAPKNVPVTEFDVSLTNINTLLGTQISGEEVMDVLTRLDFSPVQDGDKIHVVIPSYRQDITMEADIAEEVIRIVGFDDLPSTMPVMPATVGAFTKRQAIRRKIRNYFTNRGVYEALTYTLVGQKELEDAIMPFDSYVTLAAPMSEDKKYVRTSILPSLLNAVSYNANHAVKDIPLFEMSNTYSEDVVQERLAVVLSGSLQKSRWQKLDIVSSFYTLKGMVQTLLENLGYTEARINWKENTKDVERFHPYQSAEVYIGKDLFGILGVAHPTLCKKYDIPKNTVMCELNLELIMEGKAGKVKYQAVSKYPSVTRDLAFVVKEDVKIAEILKAIKKNGKNIIQGIEVFDIYQGEHVEKGSKSVALSIVFQASDRTLKDDEINTVFDKILASLEKDVKAELRK